MPGENRSIARSWIVLLALALTASVAHAQEAPRPVNVRFELNDAQVKGRRLEGVAVSVSPVAGGAALSSGRTGADGRWTTPLPPGAYQVSYRLEGYVPYTSESTEVREDGQLVTVSLSRMLEATESSGREVRIILNWGSRPDQVKDADSHVACPCGSGLGHVYFQNRTHEEPEHEVELDVDDTDWGGPETITLTRPVPGTYVYWVHDFSGPPATLGASDVVVRVVIGSQEAGEFRVFKGVTRRAEALQGHRGEPRGGADARAVHRGRDRGGRRSRPPRGPSAARSGVRGPALPRGSRHGLEIPDPDLLSARLHRLRALSSRPAAGAAGSQLPLVSLVRRQLRHQDVARHVGGTEDEVTPAHRDREGASRGADARAAVGVEDGEGLAARRLRERVERLRPDAVEAVPPGQVIQPVPVR